jgi:hypothetical protein
VDVAELRSVLQRGGEPEATRLQVLPQQLWQARLIEGCMTFGELSDLDGVDVDSENIMPERCHAGRVNCTKIASANDGDTHSGSR